MSVHQLPDGRWVVHFPKGKIPDRPNATREYFGRGQEAENKARLRNIELGLGKNANAAGKTFRELANYYLEAAVHRVEERSLDVAITHISAHLDPFFGDHDVANITEEMVDSYVANRRTAPWRPARGGAVRIGVTRSTIKRELTTMQAVLNFGVRRKQILYNPIQHYDMPRDDDAVIAPATQDELTAILQHSPPHLQRFILLAYYTACRPGPSELLSMRWDQCDFAGRTIFVVSARKGGLRSRRIAMHPGLEESLSSWYNEDMALLTMPEYIVHYRGRKLGGIQYAWDAAKKRAKVLRRLRPYDIRHSSITDMLESGSDLKSVSLIAGHASPAMTMRKYQHASVRLQQQAIAGLNGLVNIGKRDGDSEKKRSK